MSMGSHAMYESTHRRPGDGDFRSLLVRNDRLLSRSLKASDRVLSDMCEVEYFGDKVNDISRQQTTTDKVNALLQVLRGVPQQQASDMQTKFLDSLRQDGQEHVANIFRKESGQQPISDKTYRLLTSQVTKILIPSPQLLEKLVDDTVFSYDDVDQITKHKDDIQQMTQEFVDIISRKSEAALDQFVAALVQTGQIHVATLFGEKSDIVPMSDKHYLSLVNATDELAEFMDPEPRLIRRLTDRNVFSLYDLERISDKNELKAKCREVIRILVRKPDSAFQKFIDALCEIGQLHVARILGHESTEIPMISAHRQRLTGKRKEISKCMDPDDSGLVESLVCKGVFTERDRNSIISKVGYEEKTLEFLDILIRKSDSAFYEFTDELRRTDQKHVVHIIIGDDQPPKSSWSIPLTEEHIRQLDGSKIHISDYMDPESSGLVDKLVKERVLSVNEAKRIKVIAKVDYGAKSMELLDIITRKSDAAFDAFIEALKSTGQTHVVYIIIGCGELPMSHLRRQIFDIMKEKLISRLTLENQLLENLIKRGVINHADENMIEACLSVKESIRLMVYLICRKPNSVFDKFIEALEESGHRHIAAALKGLDVNGKVESNFKDCSEVEKTEIVVRITRSMHGLATGSDRDDINAIRSFMTDNGFEVSSVSLGSIRISFRCFTAKSLANLKRLYTDKTLDKLFTEVFCPEFAEAGLQSLSLNIAKSEFDMCEETFGEMEQTTSRDSEASRIPHLPLELLELVLMKTIVRLYIVHCQLHHDTREAVQLAYSALAAVCYNWRATMFGWPESPTGRWFKREVRRALQKFAAAGLESLSLNIAESEFDTCEEIFGEMEQTTSRDSEASRIPHLPLELLELVLMKTIVRLYIVHCQLHHDTREAVQLAYSALAAVCYNWRATMFGWPESPTGRWFKREVRRALQKLSRTYALKPYFQSAVQILQIESNWNMALCGDKLFLVCSKIRSVLTLERNATQWSALDVEELTHPLDIVACNETRQLYVYNAGPAYASHSVWRMSTDGRDAVVWVPGKESETSSFRLISLSVRSGRLLTISPDGELVLYGSQRKELTRLIIPKVKEVQHSVETTSGTFVICCTKPRPQVIEVNDTGDYIHIFNGDQLLGNPRYLALDSDGRVFVADSDYSRVILLNKLLEMERILLDHSEDQLVALPSRICFAHDTCQLFVLGKTCIQRFAVRRFIDIS